MDDAELAAAVAKGDMVAIGLFAERFYPALFRYLWHATGRREDAEDLASQALLRARTDIARYRGDGSLAGWAYRVAHREFLRLRRRQALAALVSRRRPAAPPPNELDNSIVVRAALARLPVEQRTAFLLVHVEGLTVEEASLCLRVPTGTVKSRCHHARRRLRELLAPSFEGVSTYATASTD